LKKISHLLTLCIFLLGLTACGSNNATATSEPTTVIGLPVTPAPFYTVVALSSTPATETGTGPDYTIETETPVLVANGLDSRLSTFNDAMTALVQQEIDSFKNNLKDLPVTPIAAGSFLQIKFAQVSPPGNLLSLKFTISFYSDGAAHPGSYSRTVTYDLEAGQFVTLDQLFLPGSDYLGTISAYCIKMLKASEIGEVIDETGAQPTVDNYRNWNITADGLLISFDEYQVAAYAAGPQQVTVPYSELATIIDQQGPLAGYFSATSPVEPTAVPLEISVQDAYAKYQQGVFFLDVREQSEWDTFHIPNTTLIPLGELPNRLNELPKDQPIVVVCRSGHRSAQGRDILLNAGFANVVSVAGGLTEWSNQGYPIDGTRP
jgi:rhodanese-related sulfurtransferase